MLGDPYQVCHVQGVGFLFNNTIINEVLEVIEVPNIELDTKFRDMGPDWLRDSKVEPTIRNMFSHQRERETQY